ncbi:Asp-tRNA(Asn)/Glu-tRNA(Gln) amidotransferase subunit GatC [Acetobacteraceae bacterium]|nr:Asp-tRNA(Asn)/Glu-tRNA(Gln) amidotransferase subunit GatC [Acetobacteraceae bacterium]
MSFDITTITRVAKLAHIRLKPAEQENLGRDISNILTWVNQLSEVDVEGVAPMTNAGVGQDRLREDKVTDGNCVKDVLSNAPDAAGPYFTVPKVVE